MVWKRVQKISQKMASSQQDFWSRPFFFFSFSVSVVILKATNIDPS